MASDGLVKKIKKIIKSEEDDREYLGLILNNGLKVVLVSDPKADKSAAAINVGVGYMCDPPELPGLAHFCEHMLFLGNEKYPEENEYMKFLSGHGGASNAFTTCDHTCYHFDVAPESLIEALDRFAQFFICPLFTEAAVEREVNAINSEHEKNLQLDVWRKDQLEKATGNPHHDFSKFGTGNIETLWTLPNSKGIQIRDELLKFYKKYYSSNIMTLAIVGKETIEELTDVVTAFFSEIQNKNVHRPEWPDHPFDSEHVKLQGYMVPVKEIRVLIVTFAVPDIDHLYRSDPAHYLSHLIGHEGEGSLLSELKRQGWGNHLACGYKTYAKGFASIFIEISLTVEGQDHTNEIVTLIFQYVNMLKSSGPQEWIFQECKAINSMQFRFKDRERPSVYACTISRSMYDFPMEDVLCGHYLVYDFEPGYIDDLLKFLNPDNIRVAVISKKFESMCTTTEKWYGTKYHAETISENILKMWRDPPVHTNLKLPSANEFIPTDYSLVTRETESSPFPELLKNTVMGRLWFKQDNVYRLPKAVLCIELGSPYANVDPLTFNMSRLFIELVRDSLTEYLYDAEIAGLCYSISAVDLGIYLCIKGYNNKQHVLLQKIMQRLTTFQIDQKRFDIFKEEITRKLRNFKAEIPYNQNVCYTTLVLTEHSWSVDEMLYFAEEMTVDRLQKHITLLFSKIHIEALVHGNVTKQDALNLMNIIENSLKESSYTLPVLPRELNRDREIQLANGSYSIYAVENEIHTCSSIENYYQCGIQTNMTNPMVELFCLLISEPCFTFLRTTEQLGYVVTSSVRQTSGVQGVRILVQSDKPPTYVDERIEAFLHMFGNHILEMEKTEFERYVSTHIQKRLEKPKKLSAQTDKYWLEIVSHKFDFNRDSVEVEFLKTVSKEQMYEFYKNLIAYDAPNRKKLSVRVISNVRDENEVPCNPPSPPAPPQFYLAEEFQDVNDFKKHSAFYPLPKPAMEITSPFKEINSHL